MLSVAPEGTLSNGRCLLSFKTGAFVAGTPVVPILLRYKLTPFNPSWSIIIPFWHLVSWRAVLLNRQCPLMHAADLPTCRLIHISCCCTQV
jgi:hypothetical protein